MYSLRLEEITLADFKYLKSPHCVVKTVDVNKNTNFQEEFFALLEIVEPKYGNDGEKYSLIHLSTPVVENDKFYKLVVENDQDQPSPSGEEKLGTVIGTIAYDQNQKDLKVTVLKDKKDSET
ncbi:MAG: hypothetical protein KBB75_01760 [Candidatus Pacebacteria bacterium]|nr:hypothetical protein [Candidatus Paceibacterota bacterium]